MADRSDSRGVAGLLKRLLRPAPKPAPRSVRSIIEVEHGGTIHRVSLKRVASARRFTLRVRATRRDAVLTMPPNASAKAATAFANRHADWIGQRLAALAPTIPFSPGSEIPFRGEAHRIVHRPGLRRRVWSEAAAGDALPSLCVSGPESGLESAVAAFLQREASTDLGHAVARYAQIVDRPVKSVRLRDTRSRWGSCSGQGALNFSWRLILAPPFVLDYLAAHEVAHLVHMNHSDAYWAVTHRIAPRTDEAEAWLRAHGAGLHRYGS